MRRNRLRAVPSSQSDIIPAPVGGWNARDSLAAMPRTDAPLLENFYPSATNVTIRGGELDWATGVPSAVKTLISFAGSATARLFAATNAGLFDVTSAGAVGAAVAAITAGDVSHTNFSVAGGNYLIIVNGEDELLQYDGSTWQFINAGTTPSITGVTSSDLSFVASFKRRLWFVEKNSMSLWYLPVGQIGGAATEFDVGPLFKRGGTVVAITGWTMDGGEGVDDYFVVASSEGELAVYKGTDPASILTWALVGLYYIGEPLNNRCFISYGGDLLFLCRIGLYPLSKALVGNPTLEGLSLAGKIQTAFNQAIATYGDLPGWQMCVYPKQGALLLNVPVAAGVRWDQFVQNMLTGSWTKFTGWNGNCMAVHNKQLFLGKAGTVTKLWVGESDLASANIQATAVQAFTTLRMSGREKEVKLLRPFLKINGNFSLASGIAVDYNLNTDFTMESVDFSEGGIWDESDWDDAYWALDEYNYQEWQTPDADTGRAIAIKLRIESNSSTISWNATELVYTAGAVL